MKKLFLILTLLLTTLLSCKSKKPKPALLKKERQEKVIAVVTLPDSSKAIEILYRVIGVGVKTDSLKGEYDAVIDTSWFLIRSLQKKSPSGKPMVDSIGKPVMEDYYYFRPKDSVMWRISGIPVDSLLSKTKTSNL